MQSSICIKVYGSYDATNLACLQYYVFLLNGMYYPLAKVGYLKWKTVKETTEAKTLSDRQLFPIYVNQSKMIQNAHLGN